MGISDLAVQFEGVFARLLVNEQIDLYESGVSLFFEVVASCLFSELPTRKWSYFDGVVPLDCQRKTQRKIEFTGKMWVGQGAEQWQEPFYANVVDKRITKQGIWLTLQVGPDRAESELYSALGLKQRPSQATQTDDCA